MLTIQYDATIECVVKSSNKTQRRTFSTTAITQHRKNLTIC
ncbi:hypothetical protein BAZSYMA_ACONTIG00585_1 [Bathymodiolus azoricus thioautotrophic gill symbiont]|uniref:Uncharacterized protein n=1 Tax=Bathymodiolus azoricus thioautotrophic gill symbiont TaxID=235205 RepID=A0A1H6K0H6_9GAMM|nr:hypothetical protein BAZSYMA_ACONTIG00585_1 [Bathymodiolus azoricus thioautotrophic gill symbiont]